MPTSRPRHTITEVGEVEEALNRVRELEGTVDVRRLVVLGAEVAVEQAQEHRRDREEVERLRARLLERLRTGRGLDREAAEDVRARGWSRRL